MKFRYNIYRIGINVALILALLLSCIVYTAAQSEADSIVFSAMQDELFRNYRELSADDMDSPFFIAYTLADAKTVNISASLGALNYTNENQYKDWHVRLMAGDYKINDENFYSTQPDEVVFRQQIQMPVDNDYEGIRRSLWLTTNNVFYSASRKYKNKMALIENKQITEADLEIDDFSREAVVKERIFVSNEMPDIKLLEDKARELSAIFCKYPEIFSSSVQISVFQSTVYFVNTEGSEVQFPLCLALLRIKARTMAEDSDHLSSDLAYVTKHISEWPSQETLSEEVEVMLTNLLKLKDTPRFDDDYFGPVLMIGEVGAETMERFLFTGSDALIAKRETLQSGSQRSVYYTKNENSLQAKIDKQIVSKAMTITAEPYLESFQGVDLIGSFKVDAEAVVPAEKMVLVENGVLKTLLNGRTPSREVPQSNGHMRFDYSQGGLNKTVGPGVIRITTTDTLSMPALKDELIKQAKELGLDYAIMIKSLDIGGSDKPINFYMVDVETGEETLTRAVKLRNLNRHSFRRSPMFSNSFMLHNTLLPLSNSSGSNFAGMPASFILPEGILLKDVELESYRKSLTSLLPLIENPVSISKETNKAISTQEEE